jgi:hypothetical protein
MELWAETGSRERGSAERDQLPHTPCGTPGSRTRPRGTCCSAATPRWRRSSLHTGKHAGSEGYAVLHSATRQHSPHWLMQASACGSSNLDAMVVQLLAGIAEELVWLPAGCCRQFFFCLPTPPASGDRKAASCEAHCLKCKILCMCACEGVSLWLATKAGCSRVSRITNARTRRALGPLHGPFPAYAWLLCNPRAIGAPSPLNVFCWCDHVRGKLSQLSRPPATASSRTSVVGSAVVERSCRTSLSAQHDLPAISSETTQTWPARP